MGTAGAPTLHDLLDRRAAEAGDRDALVFPGERASFAELAEASLEAARRLSNAGVETGDRVGLLLPGSIDAYALVLGAMRLGAIPLPINGRFKARELGYVIRHSGATLVVAEPAAANLLEEAGAAAHARVVLGPRAPELTGLGAKHVGPVVGAEDDAMMLYTSGTTADPKGCVHRHSAVVAEGERLAERLRLTPDDRFWTPLPFFHIGGIGVLAGCITGGCASLQMGFFDPATALEQLEDERVTVAFPAFETIWLAVLNQPRFPEADLSQVRVVVNVGVPSSLRAMQERVPHAPQISCFGSTELCSFSCLGEPDDPLESRLTTSGFPLRDIELRIVDGESGVEVGPGVAGEILVRGPTRFVRYHEDPEATAAAIDADGWFHSGDLGKLDEDGRLSFTGRLKDMLKVGGENVAAAEVEEFLMTHEAVEIVQVVGVPDTRYVEVAAAFVQLRSGTSAGERELIEHCLGRIATFKVPRYVRFVDEWPMSGTKIQKFVLRDRLVAELDAAGSAAAPSLSSGGAANR